VETRKAFRSAERFTFQERNRCAMDAKNQTNDEGLMG